MNSIRMLVTDLDGTLLGDANATARFHAWRAGEGQTVTLVYATGRTVANVSHLVADGTLPRPEFTLGALGTEVFDHGSNRLTSVCPTRGHGHWDARQVTQILAHHSGVKLQPQEFQSPYKVSLFLVDAGPDELAAIVNVLRAAHIDFEITYSGARFLDVLPRGVSKGTTARLLAHRQRVPPSRIVAVGDSGNDVTLFEQGFLGVLVGNAEPDLVRRVPASTFRSERPYADGVLDGLQYWQTARKRSTAAIESAGTIRDDRRGTVPDASRGKLE